MLKTTNERAARNSLQTPVFAGGVVYNPQTTEQFSCAEPSGDAYTYRIDAHAKAHVVRCAPAGEKVVVPELLGGCTVVGFDEGSFASLMKVKHVLCPSGLQTISDRAFGGCLRLESIALNDGLRYVGSEAFSLCTELQEIALPESVESVGAHLTGSGSSTWSARPARVLVSPESEFLFFDEAGMLYQRSVRGNVLLDACGFEGDELVIAKGTVEIAPQALSQLVKLTSVRMPEGLIRIGESAFRGCVKLSEVELSATLERIENGAFACTRISRIAIPASCWHIAPLALNTSTALPETIGTAYSSTLEQIEVHPDNPAYCMVGPVMCAKTATGLRAVFCEADADTVDLSSVSSVDVTAFAGTGSIGHLVLSRDVRFDENMPLLAHGRCGKLTLRCASADGHEERMDLEIPSGQAGVALMKSGLSGGTVDIERFLALYDEAVAEETDELAKAREMVARLAAPRMLSAQSKDAFSESVTAAFESICIQFGARSYFEGFEQLMDCGILNESNISSVIALLSGYGDAPSSGYLLESKRGRYGNAAFDYEL